MNWSSNWGDKSDEPKPVSKWANKSADDSVSLETSSITKNNKTINVTVVGDLGLDYEGEEWNIYHLPTLATFNKAVPLAELIYDSSEVIGERCYDKPELLRWMARVQENYPTSWQMLRQLTPDTYLDNGHVAKEIIQKWCLSVPVV